MSTLRDEEGAQAEGDPHKMMKEEIQRKKVERAKSWPLHRDHSSARVIDKKFCLWAFMVESVLCYYTSVWRAWECRRSIIKQPTAYPLGTSLEQEDLPSSSLPNLFSSLNLFDILLLVAHRKQPGLKIPAKLSCNHKMQPHFCHWTIPPTVFSSPFLSL